MGTEKTSIGTCRKLRLAGRVVSRRAYGGGFDQESTVHSVEIVGRVPEHRTPLAPELSCTQ